MRVKALVITGFGLNCEAETAHALRLAGAEPNLIHLNDLMDAPERLDDYQILAFVGGFSFGDHIAAGTVFANRLRHRMAEPLDAFVRSGRLVIGICNGFQVMVKLGILPGIDGDYRSRRVTLTANDSGVFRNAWIRARANADSPCVFTKGIDLIDLPIRHGEGKFVVDCNDTLDRMRENGQIALQYVHPETGEPTEEFPHNPNGSPLGVAGVCDPTGRIFGLMPHPEAYSTLYNHPLWTRMNIESSLTEEGAGIQIFRNGVEFAQGVF